MADSAAALPELVLSTSRDFLSWLAARNASLAFTTYQAGDASQWLRIEGVVDELYDVFSLPRIRRPMALGFKTDETRRFIRLRA